MCGLVSLTLLAFAAFPAHAQNQLWITQFGTSNRDIAWALAPDDTRGVIVAGQTEGSLGGPNAGGYDAFLARYDSAGHQLWIRQFGTSSDDIAYALAPDGVGGVMIAGTTKGDLGGPNAGTPWTDAFLARYNDVGDQLWIRQFGSSTTDRAYALAPDGSGGVMVAGYTGGSLGGAHAGRGDAFLARYDSAGIQLWIRQFGTDRTDEALALTPDGTGGVLIAGDTTGSLGGPSAGFWDVFLARYDSAGNQLWISQFGSSSNDQARAVALDGAGGVMVAGWTDGGLGGPNAGDSADVFLARFDSTGNELWIRQFGTRGWDEAEGLVPDGAGGVVVTGRIFVSTGVGGAGHFDAFLTRYDSDGNRLWFRRFGTSSPDLAWGLAPGGAGGVMVAGDTSGSLGGPNAGDYDVFLARYTIDSCPCACDFDTSTGIGVCDLIDFTTFAGLFATGDPCACDIDTSTGMGVCDLVDFTNFAGQFAAGCP